GTILPSEEDRKRIITQMKVRTTLKGDKSWIHHRSDSEEKQNHSPLTPCTAPSSHREPQSPSAHKNLSPKGVFTKTIDKSSPSKPASNGTQKSIKSPSQTSPSTQGPKMSTEDYKKLTEAASSVLRRTAGRERSYVLSAAKKTGGSPTQEVPAFVAKNTNGERRTSESPQSASVRTSCYHDQVIATVHYKRPISCVQMLIQAVEEMWPQNPTMKLYSIALHLWRGNVHDKPQISEKNELQSHTFFDKIFMEDNHFLNRSALELKHEDSNGERKPKDPDSKAAELCHHQPTTEKENIEVSPGMGCRTSTPLDNNEAADSKRGSSFATESRITSPQNQYRDQRSDKDSDSVTYYPFRDAGTNVPKSHRVPFYKDICDTETGRTLTDSEAKDLPASFEQKNFSNYESDPSASGKGLLFVKESIKSMELSSSPRHNSRSLVDLSELENPSYSSSSYLNSTPSKSAESATSQWETSWIKSSFIGILSTVISAMRSSFR
ncbi:hypothetical protein Chor_004575, partial [Crotalus horridus]